MSRRAFTLLEVLAAVIILAMAAVVAAPIWVKRGSGAVPEAAQANEALMMWRPGDPLPNGWYGERRQLPTERGAQGAPLALRWERWELRDRDGRMISWLLQPAEVP